MDLETRIRNVTAVLGPTNTGKTHLAIERMLGHKSGLIGLPLRLLAREVYDKVAQRVGTDAVALITGEEKIKPEGARYWVCTVEAMPHEVQTDFLAIDEVQLAADPERGHVFTDRLLNTRGVQETLLLGAGTMRDAISELIPGANFISRPRLSKLTYSGQKKITRLPSRTAIVAFSASEVYSIAELIRRQRGGAAVVLGALSPRTRNAQVALYQSGDVGYIVATDAIGMGLNLDVDHVAFAGTRKFDGQVHRELSPSEIGQVAGRAGRHMNDGRFGVTGDVEPFAPDLVERLEEHRFDSVKQLQWRSRDLEFGTLERLRESLKAMPKEARLSRARMSDDTLALESLSGDSEVIALANGKDAVSLLWDVCQIPDYRKISTQSHAELVGGIYRHLRGPDRVIPEDWFRTQVDQANRTDGDIDTLATRLAHIRTWTFVSNRPGWLKDPEHWQGRTREIEDTLSDALHEQLTARFIDRRTSALMRGMRDKDELDADIAADGAIKVEDHFVGRIKGFRFIPDTQAEDIHGKAARGAATQVLAKELAMRARRVSSAKADAFKLALNGRILWRDDEIARLEPSGDPLKPTVVLVCDEHLTGPDKEKVQARLDQWIVEIVAERLGPLVEISKAEDVSGLARGIAFRLTESFGVLKRDPIAEEIKTLDQTARAQLRKYGVRFGAFNIYFPLLLKPSITELRVVLWALKNGEANGLSPETLPPLPRAGLTSLKPDPKVPETYYRVAGYHTCGPRAVRLDMLERLADTIRSLLAFRAKPDSTTAPPKGSTGDGGFVATPEMMSILGCSQAELGDVLRALGFRSEKRPIRPRPAAPAKPAPTSAETTPAPGPDAAPVSIGEALMAEADQSSGTAPENAAAPPAAGATAPEQPVAEIATPDAVAAPAEGEVAAPTTAEPTSAEASPATPAAADAAPPPAPAMEEVWRPRRHRQSEHQPRERSGRPHQRHPRQGDRRATTGEPVKKDGEGTPVAAKEAATEGAAEGQRVPHQRRPDDRNKDRNGDRNRQRRDGKPDGGERGERRPDRGPRPDRGDRPRREDGGRRREEGGRPPMVRTAAPPRTGADASSPFAALSALKEQLEKRGRE